MLALDVVAITLTKLNLPAIQYLWNWHLNIWWEKQKGNANSNSRHETGGWRLETRGWNESQVLKYLSVQGARIRTLNTLIAQMKYWEIEGVAVASGWSGGRTPRVTQADLAGARHPSNLMAVQARDSCTESVSQSVGQSIKPSLNYINQMSGGRRDGRTEGKVIQNRKLNVFLSGYISRH